MDPSRVTLTLLIGPVVPVPAPAFMSEALDSVEVNRSDYGPTGFQLTFNADRSTAFTMDYQMLLLRLAAVGNRVVVMVQFGGGLPTTLADGFVTNMQMSQGGPNGSASITLTGEDVGIKMDLTEKSVEYPMLGDFEIADLILAEYALYGVIPVVIPTPTSLASDPLERVPRQYGTDRQHLNYLASKHGYVFTVRPGPAPLTNLAYWGPPVRVGLPQPTLNVDMGPATNVLSINFQYDGLAPTRYTGTDQDSETELDLPVDTFVSTRIPLCAMPAMIFDGGLGRTEIFDIPGMTEGDALAYAQSLTDRSTDNVVTADVEVDSLRYGAIADAPGLIAVRGCGLSYDGIYYVSAVSHSLRRGEYRQRFTLSREGLMTLTPIVPP